MSFVVLNAVTVDMVDEGANLNAMLEELESLLMMHMRDAQTGTPGHHDIIDVITENTPGMEDDRVVAIYEKLEAELVLVLVQPPEEQHSDFVHAAQGGWFHVLVVRETSWNMLPPVWCAWCRRRHDVRLQHLSPPVSAPCRRTPNGLPVDQDHQYNPTATEAHCGLETSGKCTRSSQMPVACTMVSIMCRPVGLQYAVRKWLVKFVRSLCHPFIYNCPTTCSPPPTPSPHPNLRHVRIYCCWWPGAK